jgi:pyruvate/2-oxoglutarate dehydrogenase complex dihydrolipoamide acyltransferase (E2) component
MAVDVVIPQVGESVQEAILAEWFKEDGDSVAKDEALFVIETDKVTLEVVAEVAGKLSISVPAGETVTVGAVVATIDPSAQAARVRTCVGSCRANTDRETTGQTGGRAPCGRACPIGFDARSPCV